MLAGESISLYASGRTDEAQPRTFVFPQSQSSGFVGSDWSPGRRNSEPTNTGPGPSLPGSVAGLLGLQERVALTGGTLVHGPDGSGNFVVEADLRW
jgi:hypothetical protein